MRRHDDGLDIAEGNNLPFVRTFEQASHGGELVAGVVTRAGVTELGRVLLRDASGRQSPDDITLFDSTGLAIQDLAIAIAAYGRRSELELPTLDL